jgi:hypothetical protein
MKKIELEIKKLKLQNMILFFLLLVMMGGVSNLNAVASNGGKMPVLSNYYWETNTHFGYKDSSEINYPSIVDRFKIETENWVYSFSIGDVLLYLFSALALISTIYLSYLEIRYRKVYKEDIYNRY